METHTLTHRYMHTHTHSYIHILHTHTQWNTAQPWKNKTIPFATAWIDLEDYYAKLNKSVREMHVLYDIPYMYNPPHKIQQTSEYNKSRADSKV